ncbi:phenol degradation protein meta [Martelella endophytica]|uniref:Phenol degradation protein meta n=1 Tax=Martelella endophytica TaxID=1486262 RepID=A0A0D5LVI7_MAREN|nr:phenol degradation protein meta [Martelella endophytica]
MSASVASVLAASTVLLTGAGAEAAESGTGFYLLGSKGPMAGVLAPPGAYFANDLYFYSGSAGASVDLPIGGSVVADIDATAVIDLATGLWVLPEGVAGGNLGLTVTVPWGYQKVDASAALSGGGLGTAIDDNVSTIGDPVIGATLGWHSGNWHWTAGTLVNVPIGDYQEGEIANVAFHRWGADLNAAVTWLDATSGWEASAAAGFTFNGENPATDYKTGTEFHLEGAFTKTFESQLSAGLVGYYYQQLTADSGPGASLGDFKGRVAAIGATVGYNFVAGETPISLRAKIYHEFDAKNRLEGTSGYLSLSLPF